MAHTPCRVCFSINKILFLPITPSLTDCFLRRVIKNLSFIKAKPGAWSQLKDHRSWNSAQLCGSLDGRGCGGKGPCIWMTESLHCYLKLSQHCLLVSYIPIQNKKFKNKQTKDHGFWTSLVVQWFRIHQRVQGMGSIPVLCLVSQSCPTLQSHGLWPSRLLCPWGFSRQEYWSGLPCPPWLWSLVPGSIVLAHGLGYSEACGIFPGSVSGPGKFHMP